MLHQLTSSYSLFFLPSGNCKNLSSFDAETSFWEEKWTPKYLVFVFQVWRFFITFSDVLELWPFTLDEFVQALHDYVSHPCGHFLPNQIFSSLLPTHFDTFLKSILGFKITGRDSHLSSESDCKRYRRCCKNTFCWIGNKPEWYCQLGRWTSSDCRRGNHFE